MTVADSYEHPSFPKPPPASRLWRYMDWPKFEWLVRERRLWMSSLPALEDKFEGKTPNRVIETLADALANATSDEDRSAIRANIERVRRFARAFYPHYFVSCWRLSQTESAIMWGAYTKTHESVAIETTIEILRKELPPYVNIGLVQYIDYTMQSFSRMNMFEWPMHKRLEYDDDREVRAVACAVMPDELGGAEMRQCLFEPFDGARHKQIYAPRIDPVRLSLGVYLHPKATSEFVGIAAQFCAANSLPAPQQSLLAAEGVF